MLEHEKLALEVLHSGYPQCSECQSPFLIKLGGGLININMAACNKPPECDPVVFSLYPNNPLRRDKELYLRDILNIGPDPILTPILGGGIVNHETLEIPYMLTKYIEGKTVYDFLNNSDQINSNDIRLLVEELGLIMARIHNISNNSFGEIRGSEVVESDTWEDVYQERLECRVRRILDLDPEKKVGKYIAKDIQKLIPNLLKIVEQDSQYLQTVDRPYLVHGDLHFLNMMVAEVSEIEDWHLEAILDMEDAFWGDPEVDLVSLESQLFLAPDIAEKIRVWFDDMRNSYSSAKDPSPYYWNKRKLYHIPWSLSYFGAVFNMDTELHLINEQVESYMDQHYKVLLGLSEGLSLDEIGIPNLWE